MGDEVVVTPVPDPTVLTTAALTRGLASERDYLDAQLDVLRERLRGIDRATELLNHTVTQVPTDVQKEVQHLRELTEVRFGSIVTQFHERDTRQERESRDSKVALDAALAAQKDAAHQQNNSNSLAINKSEQATTETISKLAELFKTATDGLSGKLDDLKERVVQLESIKRGGKEQLAGIYALGGFIAVLIVLAGFLAATGAFDK